MPTVAIRSGSSHADLAAAARILQSGNGTVLFEDFVLCGGPGHVRCDVPDYAPSARRCATEYEVLVENARRVLDASEFRGLMPRLPLRWRVVEATENGIVELWPCETR